MKTNLKSSKECNDYLVFLNNGMSMEDFKKIQEDFRDYIVDAGEINPAGVIEWAVERATSVEEVAVFTCICTMHFMRMSEPKSTLSRLMMLSETLSELRGDHEKVVAIPTNEIVDEVKEGEQCIEVQE
jgi:hypothetical protein